jgi:hypothetical protein
LIQLSSSLQKVVACFYRILGLKFGVVTRKILLRENLKEPPAILIQFDVQLQGESY